MPQTFSANFLPHGLSIDPSTGTITGDTDQPWNVHDHGHRNKPVWHWPRNLNLTINGRIGPDSTPWPVNLARKGTVAFADLTTLPSNPAAITTAQIKS